MNTEMQEFTISLTGNTKICGEFTNKSPRDKVIILCHGFGVDRYSLGMFTDIAGILASKYTVILFDFFEINKRKNEARISTYTQ